MTVNPNPPRSFFAGADSLTDNYALLEWCETSRRLLHAGALELGICASELEARLKSVKTSGVTGGMSARARARQVARPIQQGSEALVIASQYIITASNRFMAAYMPELEQVGFQGARKPEFRFKA